MASSSSSPVEWSIKSWRQKEARQQPPYEESSLGELGTVLAQVNSLPPLVSVGEIVKLKKMLADAGEGKSFVLQGGDCAERFVDCNKSQIENKLRVLLQMSLVLVYRASVPVVRIWRGAGQFAKPRSSNVETLDDGRVVPSFRGDNVNGFSVDERKPEPQRLVQAYFHSAATLNYIRALVDGGFASLFYPHSWDLEFIKSDKVRSEYNAVLDELERGLDLLRTIGAAERMGQDLDSITIGTSHEGLILAYEEALSEVTRDGDAYNLGAHFLWIGDRTRQLDGAHVEYFRGIKNPIGLKCGPSLEPAELASLVRRLNPDSEPGRLTLITRYGASKIAELLPAHIAAVKETGIRVTWICDAVHGNTFVTDSGFKSRDIENIWSEIQQAITIHADAGSVLGGVHLELTGENVTECVGGTQELEADQLSQAYETFCDPRLNYTQSLDIAFRLSNVLGRTNKK
jgi:3-deoxy-7-phosphoheptulonate synthase